MTRQIKPKIRVTLDLEEDLNVRLEALTETIGAASKADTIRNALRLFEYVVKRHKDGYEFILRKDDRAEVIPLSMVI